MPKAENGHVGDAKHVHVKLPEDVTNLSLSKLESILFKAHNFTKQELHMNLI